MSVFVDASLLTPWLCFWCWCLLCWPIHVPRLWGWSCVHKKNHFGKHLYRYILYARPFLFE